MQAGVASREAELDQLKQQLEEERAAVLQVRATWDRAGGMGRH
jgi:multidrug resistance efflux pump